MAESDLGFHTRPGVRLAGVLHLPDGADATHPAPGVVLCQGLSGVKHLVLPDVAARFAAAGFATLRFDYAGYGDSEGERGWIDPRGRTDDALHALAALADRPEIDASRLGLYGHSYGGPVAIAAASRDRRVRAVVAVSGPGPGPAMLQSVRASWDWVAFRHRVEQERTSLATTGEAALVDVGEIFPFSPAFLAAYQALKAEGGSSAMTTGGATGVDRFFLASVDAMVDFHPEDAARRLGPTAVLLVHGEDDDTAMIETVTPVYDNVPGPKRWDVIPGAAHNDLDAGPGLADALDRAAAWFGSYLG